MHYLTLINCRQEIIRPVVIFWGMVVHGHILRGQVLKANKMVKPGNTRGQMSYPRLTGRELLDSCAMAALSQ